MGKLGPGKVADLLKAPQGASARSPVSCWLSPTTLPSPRQGPQSEPGEGLRASGSCFAREQAHTSPGGTLPQGAPRNVRPGREQSFSHGSLEKASEHEVALSSIFPKKPRQPCQSQEAQECSVSVVGPPFQAVTLDEKLSFPLLLLFPARKKALLHFFS